MEIPHHSLTKSMVCFGIKQISKKKWTVSGASTGIMRWSRYNSRGGIKKSKGWLEMPGIFVNTWRVFCWISQGCFAGWAAALIWVTSIRQGRVARSVLTAGRASKISCGGRRAAALWSESDCTWDAPLRPAGLPNGTCGDTRACLALHNSWRNVIGGETGRCLVWERWVVCQADGVSGSSAERLLQVHG